MSIPECKIVFVGEAGVGKTCILQYLMGMNFDFNTVSNMSATNFRKQITLPHLYKKTVMIDLWDTAGQEKYRALTRNFYKDTCVAILVYDITRKNSFDALKSYWYNDVVSVAGKNIIIAIAGNKCDMFENEEVTEEEAKKYAQKIGAFFRLTSPYEKIGIDEIIEFTASKYLCPKFTEEDMNLNNIIKVPEKRNTIDKKFKESKIKLDQIDEENNKGKKNKQKKCC